MLRIAIIILALAAYGAYSLFGSLSGNSAQVVVPTVAVEPTSGENTFSLGLGGAKDMAVAAAAKATGLTVTTLPMEGCSDSVLSPLEVERLVMQLPDAQRQALATLLNASSSVWTVQLYRGVKGVGLCLPVHEKLIVFPVGASSVINQAGAAIAPLQAGLTQ